VSLDENKTDDPRTWALDPSTRRGLKIWKDDFRTQGSQAQRLIDVNYFCSSQK
jgi:hypothetical protein